ncbi:MAG: extracellular solute-binding protein [Oscillospiraceae bacterium]|nr:extracellular solute-binding protein [Oscillospiraceae bacterium]
MQKYIKAVLLLLLAATPIVLILMLFSSEVLTPDMPDDPNYAIEDTESQEINFGDTEVETAGDAEYIPQVTILRLGGMWIPFYMILEIEQFNRDNRGEYRIEVTELFGWQNVALGGSAEHVDVEQRIRQEGFDIVYLNVFEPRSFAEGSFSWTDLYARIDSDPELNRTDFFQSVLAANEAPDGTLPIVATNFWIDTMIAQRENAELITPLTFENLLRQLREPPYPELLPSWNDWLLTSAALDGFGNNFFDMDNGWVNFQNDDFVKLLELMNYIPRFPFEEVEDGYLSEVLQTFRENDMENFLNGDMLMYPFNMGSPVDFQIHRAVFGDIVAVGHPFVAGGRHIIRQHTGVGINAQSQHQDAAWNFVRQTLLPSHRVTFHIPMRIDLFEEHINGLMRELVRDGVELARTVEWWSAGYSQDVYIYSMTEDEAQIVREIIESAVPMHIADVRWEIYDIIWEELNVFLETEQTAEETAAIIQARVEEFLGS